MVSDLSEIVWFSKTNNFPITIGHYLVIWLQLSNGENSTQRISASCEGQKSLRITVYAKQGSYLVGFTPVDFIYRSDENLFIRCLQHDGIM